MPLLTWMAPPCSLSCACLSSEPLARLDILKMILHILGSRNPYEISARFYLFPSVVDGSFPFPVLGYNACTTIYTVDVSSHDRPLLLSTVCTGSSLGSYSFYLLRSLRPLPHMSRISRLRPLARMPVPGLFCHLLPLHPDPVFTIKIFDDMLLL